MSMVRLLNLGGKDSLKYYKVMQKKIIIWNMDETGVFWQALPDRGFGSKGRQCKGGKKSKQRVTIALFVSAAGKKESPFLFGGQKVHDVCVDLTNLFYQSIILAKAKLG